MASTSFAATTTATTTTNATHTAKSMRPSLMEGWLDLTDSVVVKEYADCLTQDLKHYQASKNQHKAINNWHKSWVNDREMRKSNGEHLYEFSVLDYMDSLHEDQQILEEIKFLQEQQKEEHNEFDDIYA